MQHEVWIPPLHRDLSQGAERLTLTGETVGDLIDELEQRFPGMKDRLCDEGRIRPHIAVAVNGLIVSRGLRQRLTEPSEVHFVPAMGGGAARGIQAGAKQ